MEKVLGNYMNFDLDKIKEAKYSVVRKSLVGKSKGLPSKERRHIKDQKKVDLAIKELYEKHNHSWYDEVLLRNKDNMHREALFYRGNSISYEKMFEEADKLVSALSNYGLKKGDEVLMCVSNTPEMVYLLLACSKLGLKPNIFGADFNKEYIKEIIEESHAKIIFMSDDNSWQIQDIVDKANISKKVVYSVTDSFNLEYIFKNQPYYVWDFEDKLKYISFPKDYCTLDKFIVNYCDGNAVVPNVSLDDDFTITYTSGSTKNGRPKAIIHRVRSFNAMGRFHDQELSGTPSMKNHRSLAHIPPHSNTCLITSISDLLFQGGSVALEPIYNKEHFLESLIFNEPTLVPATRSFWIEAMKNYLYNPMYKDLKFPHLLAPIAVGESVSPNEEKFINQCFKKLSMGTKAVPFPLSPVTLSIGGGDCEHGGLFFTLFKRLRERISFSNEEYGLKPFALANIKVLDQNLNECGFNELGMLVGDSLCTMRAYKNNPDATNEFFIEDSDLKINGNFKVWSYIDKRGHVHMKGRMGNEFITSSNKIIPVFMIADVILKDTKNIMSCEVVNVNNKLVAHIEFYPNMELNSHEEDQILSNALTRLEKIFGHEVVSNLYFMVRDCVSSYPLTGCGKRNVAMLEKEGEKVIACIDKRKTKKLVKKL